VLAEQPIDVAYIIIALAKFFKTLDVIAINIIWKLLLAGFGNNHLHQIIYNPCTGGCYDGLEENYVN
jgi:hypothetical protein